MNSRDPLTPEERELARLLGGRLDKAPPPAVDAAVLAAARASVQSAAAGQDTGPMGADDAPAQAQRRQHRRARWPTVAGIAASVVFAVGLAWQMQPQREPPPAPSLQEMATPAPRPEADPPAPRPVADTAPATPGSAATQRAQPEPAPRPPVQGQALEAPAQATAPAQVDAAPVPQAFRARAAESARVAPSRPAPPAAPAPAAAVMAAPAPAAEAFAKPARTPQDTAAQDTAEEAAATASAPLSAAAVQQEVEADARLTRRQWLQKIRHRRDAGDVDLARASLERYLAQYPETRLPRDLQPLLAD
ncbi:hypothetical protein H9654_03140 [Stenotrophomonas sp. Sa5BUN4]|uniref:Uncharacterized protein n=1 Tax=Stenotrophomonas lacuserhaii TaxID=2760084 RepID=A0A8X8FQ67_9GAMM|nr:hypothetical protein [Stenotrophomonas pennii]MBD7953192.1 hypothetical protein [Stenotrophomonas pennii]